MPDAMLAAGFRVGSGRTQAGGRREGCLGGALERVARLEPLHAARGNAVKGIVRRVSNGSCREIGVQQRRRYKRCKGRRCGAGLCEVNECSRSAVEEERCSRSCCPTQSGTHGPGE